MCVIERGKIDNDLKKLHFSENLSTGNIYFFVKRAKR
jgi:hypothetical protein